VSAADRGGRPRAARPYDPLVHGAEPQTWPWWAETLLIAGVGFTTVQEAYIGAGGTLLHPAVAVAAATSAALLLRHRLPLVVTAVTVATAAALGTVLPLLVMLFHLTARGWVVGAALCWGAAMGGNLLLQPDRELWSMRLFGPLSLPLLAVVLGLWARSRQRLAESVEARARLAERTRIAAEMHDVLAHRLSVLALHTGALQRRAPTLPPPVAERIDLLRTTSAEALADLRDVLGALYEPDETHRVPTVPDLPVLLGEARAAGQSVESDIGGEPRDVPLAYRLALHRVVQEGLTNARKHAAGAPVRVGVRYGAPTSTVEVVSSAGTTAGVTVGGHGLRGLTQRIRALDGHLEYGPTASGDWRLAATVPVPDHPPP
jgi:signal transduction histidine kinase